ncbi:unnamed protein product [Phytomonas sp. Hart1]|nr:unnamed protein product [Phytomonas sp. Hart1]|eukprot:CCW68349.1 unnamed protein product [Phytomonas sp. isolate Hart1]
MDLFLFLYHIGFFLIHGSLYLLHVVTLLLYRTFGWWLFRLAACLLGTSAEGDHNVNFLLTHSFSERSIFALTSRENRWVMDWFGLSEMESGITPIESSRTVKEIDAKSKIKLDPDLVDMYIPNYTVAPYNGHLHTIMGSCTPFPFIKMSREVVKSYDLNRLCLDFFYPTRKAVENGIYSTDNTDLGRETLDPRLPAPRAFILMLPGITGSSQDIYMRRMIAVFLKQNFCCCVLNIRGMKDTPLEVPQIYSGIFTADIRFTLMKYLRGEQIQSRLGSPRRVPIFGIGFSLGGAILSNYVGECGKKSKSSGLDAVISICAPHDFITSSVAMGKLFARWTYNRIITERLVSYCKRHARVVENCYGIDHEKLFKGSRPLLRSLRDLKSFDEHITAPHFGFSSAMEYYTAANNFPRLRCSQTPQMCVITADDPICGAPKLWTEWASLVRAQTTGLVYLEMPSGGHLGFIGSPFQVFRERANPVESLLARSVCCFVDHYEKMQMSVKSEAGVCNGDMKEEGHT